MAEFVYPSARRKVEFHADPDEHYEPVELVPWDEPEEEVAGE